VIPYAVAFCVFFLVSPIVWIASGIADFKFYDFVTILWLATSAMAATVVFLSLNEKAID